MHVWRDVQGQIIDIFEQGKRQVHIKILNSQPYINIAINVLRRQC